MEVKSHQPNQFMMIQANIAITQIFILHQALGMCRLKVIIAIGSNYGSQQNYFDLKTYNHSLKIKIRLINKKIYIRAQMYRIS